MRLLLRTCVSGIVSVITGMSSAIVGSIQGVGCSLLPEGGVELSLAKSSDPWGRGRQIMVGMSGAMPKVFCPDVSLLVSVGGVLVGGHGSCSPVPWVVVRHLMRLNVGGCGDSPM